MLDVNLFILFYLIILQFIHETSYKHRCYGAEVIYVTFYVKVLSSGMENRTCSQMCGRLYSPIFLFRVRQIFLFRVRLLDSYIYSLFNSSSHAPACLYFGSCLLLLCGQYCSGVQILLINIFNKIIGDNNFLQT